MRYLLMRERADLVRPRLIGHPTGIDEAIRHATKRLKQGDCHFGDRVVVLRPGDPEPVRVVD